MYAAARGKFDHMPALSEELSEARALAERLRASVGKSCEQTHYWYKLWLGMGTEFARTQDILTGEIDRLRRKCGEWDGTAYLDGQLQRSFKQVWSSPERHPANARVDSPGLEVVNPPLKPEEIIAKAENPA